MPSIWRDYVRFIALPSPGNHPIRLDRQWMRDFLALLALNWIGLFLCIAAIVGAKLTFDIAEPPRKPLPYSPAVVAALMIGIAPLLEELAFRSWFPIVAPAGRFRSVLRPLFPAAVWLSTLAFALLHLTNFRAMPTSVLAGAWVAPQLWSGSIFAFARVRLGFFGAFLMHGTSNAVVFAMMFAAGLPQEEYHCVPMKSGKFLCTSETGRVKITGLQRQTKQIFPERR